MSGHPGEGGDSVSTKGRQRPRDKLVVVVVLESLLEKILATGEGLFCLFVCFALSYFLFAKIRAVTLFLSKIFITF